MSVKVAGLDLSMTATGACHSQVGTRELGDACLHLIVPKEKKDFRLPEIKRQLKQVTADCDFVLLEMLPPNMKGAGITGMVQGIARDLLIEEGIRFGDIGPSALKKYATGRGVASKTEMSLAAMKRGGVEIAENNQCDAWWLWVMAHDFMDHPVIDLPKINRGELTKIEKKG